MRTNTASGVQTTYKTAMRGYKRVDNNPRSTYIAPGVPGTWLGFRQKSVHSEYDCPEEHKLGHAPHGLDEGLAACPPSPGRVNRCYVGRGKLWKMSDEQTGEPNK